MKKWRYFGRTAGGLKPFEIYRIPANGKRVSEQSEFDVERLHRDGTWAYNPKARDGILREIWTGDFSEELDEITEDEVERLFQEWSTGKWPFGN